MNAQIKIIEKIQESRSLLYLLETDMSIQQQEQVYVDVIRVALDLLKTAINDLKDSDGGL